MPLPSSRQPYPAPFRVAPRPDLGRMALLGRLGLALRPVGKLEDPHAREFVLRRAGVVASPRDQHDAAALTKLQRTALACGRRLPALLERAAETAAFALLIAVWAVVYCVVCPPAHAAARDALITDERVAVLMNLSPVLLFMALVGVLVWWNCGVPTAANDDDAPIDLAPETAPHLHDLWTSPARSDRDRA